MSKYQCTSFTLEGKRCRRTSAAGHDKCNLHNWDPKQMDPGSLRHRMMTMTLQSFMTTDENFRDRLRKELDRAQKSGDAFRDWFELEQRHYMETGETCQLYQGNQQTIWMNEYFKPKVHRMNWEMRTVKPLQQLGIAPNAKHMDIDLVVPQLFHQDRLLGDLNSAAVTMIVETRSQHGTYRQADVITLKGKTTSKYRRTVRVQRPAKDKPWDLRITRVTPDNHEVVAKVRVVEMREVFVFPSDDPQVEMFARLAEGIGSAFRSDTYHVSEGETIVNEHGGAVTRRWSSRPDDRTRDIHRGGGYVSPKPVDFFYMSGRQQGKTETVKNWMEAAMREEQAKSRTQRHSQKGVMSADRVLITIPTCQNPDKLIFAGILNTLGCTTAADRVRNCGGFKPTRIILRPSQFARFMLLCQGQRIADNVSRFTPQLFTPDETHDAIDESTTANRYVAP